MNTFKFNFLPSPTEWLRVLQSLKVFWILEQETEFMSADWSPVKERAGAL